jgi:hypothetical protein
LSTLRMTASPPVSFTIKAGREGDVVDALKFTLQQGNITPDLPANFRSVKDSDHDGVPDNVDKELITPASCFPVDENGVGKCAVPECCKLLPPGKDN